MELTEKIKKLASEAIITEQGETVVAIPREEFEQVAAALRHDQDDPMDYLRDIVGMDWGETLGALYLLESTKTHRRITLRTETPDRENPILPSVTHLWHTAEIKEREAYDFFGIRFYGNRDMRRLFLRPDWQGFPLRKDYKPADETLVMTDEQDMDVAPTLTRDSEGNLHEGTTTIFAPEDYVVNMGPQHPSTHGALRLRVALEGETVKKVDPVCGYIHRGIEKMNESLTYPQTLALTDRLDYLSAHHSRHALCMCIEQAAEIEVPERAQYIRTIMDELQRIDSHLLFYSCLVLDMGGMTPFFYGFREREMILDIFEETTGGRLIQNYNVLGGVQDDIHPEFCTRVKDFIKHMRGIIHEYHEIFTGNVIAIQRMKGIGVLSLEEVISFGATGGTGRASGWSNDVRKHHPYALYDRVDFREIVRTEGDTMARYLVRMDEIEQSMHIIEQLIDNIPDGAFRTKTKPIIRVPEGVYTASVEASRGEFAVVLESKGDKSPYRLHYRSTGLPLVHALDTACRGQKLADLIAIGASMDFVIPDIDR